MENGNQQAVVTIVDDESAPTVTLSTSASSIAENSGSTITITATMSAADTADVTVALGTSGTGTEGTDYGTISDITISAGSTTGTATFDPTMIVFMKETKLQLLQYWCFRWISYRKWNTIRNNHDN